MSPVKALFSCENTRSKVLGLVSVMATYKEVNAMMSVSATAASHAFVELAQGWASDLVEDRTHLFISGLPFGFEDDPITTARNAVVIELVEVFVNLDPIAMGNLV